MNRRMVPTSEEVMVLGLSLESFLQGGHQTKYWLLSQEDFPGGTVRREDGRCSSRPRQWTVHSGAHSNG